MNKDIFGILERVAATSSKNEKIALLEAEHGNTLLKQVLVAAYDPKITYYIKMVPNPSEDVQMSAQYSLHLAILDLKELSDRQRTGHEAAKFLAACLAMLDDANADVLKRIVKRDLRAGFSAETINKVWSGLIPSWPCMSCKPSDAKVIAKMRWPAWAQLKSDGMRFNAVVEGGTCTFIVARSGNEIDLKGQLAGVFIEMSRGQDVVFDGELLLRDKDGKIMPRKAGNGQLGKGVKGTMTIEIAERVVASMWDMIPLKDFRKGRCSVGYSTRFDALRNEISAVNSARVWLIENTEVNRLEDSDEVFQKYLSAGLEGIVLKDCQGPWEDRRVPHQIKFKDVKECDLEIIDFIEGTKGSKYEGMLGAFICATSDRKLVVNVAGMSDHERKTWWIERESMRGQIVAVKFNEVIFEEKKKVWSLFLPRIAEVRVDKIVADTLKQVQAL